MCAEREWTGNRDASRSGMSRMDRLTTSTAPRRCLSAASDLLLICLVQNYEGYYTCTYNYIACGEMQTHCMHATNDWCQWGDEGVTGHLFILWKHTLQHTQLPPRVLHSSCCRPTAFLRSHVWSVYWVSDPTQIFALNPPCTEYCALLFCIWSQSSRRAA